MVIRHCSGELPADTTHFAIKLRQPVPTQRMPLAFFRCDAYTQQLGSKIFSKSQDAAAYWVADYERGALLMIDAARPPARIVAACWLGAFIAGRRQGQLLLLAPTYPHRRTLGQFYATRTA